VGVHGTAAKVTVAAVAAMAVMAAVAVVAVVAVVDGGTAVWWQRRLCVVIACCGVVNGWCMWL